MDNMKYEYSIYISTTRRKLWNALITPSPDNCYTGEILTKLEPKVGGEIVFGALEDIRFKGKIIEFNPFKSFSFTFKFVNIPESIETKKYFFIYYFKSYEEDLDKIGIFQLHLEHTNFKDREELEIEQGKSIWEMCLLKTRLESSD